jgi:hypothetical protein
MSLGLTNHAVEQFCSRWRPDAEPTKAEIELRALVDAARPTRKRTLTGDAQLYLTLSAQGERIGFVVRDGLVITVLPYSGEANDSLVDHSISPELHEESRETLAACHAILEAEAPLRAKEAKEAALKLQEQERYNNARRVVEQFRAGDHVTPKAVNRAYEVLGIRPCDPLPSAIESPKKLARPPAVQQVFEDARKRNAEEVLRDWRNGRHFKPGAVRRAHEVLGLPYDGRKTP